MENRAHGKETHLQLSERGFDCNIYKTATNWACSSLMQIQNKNLSVDIYMFLLEQTHFSSTWIIFPSLSHHCCCFSWRKNSDALLSYLEKKEHYITIILSGICKNSCTCTQREEFNLNDVQLQAVTKRKLFMFMYLCAYMYTVTNHLYKTNFKSLCGTLNSLTSHRQHGLLYKYEAKEVLVIFFLVYQIY